MFIPSVTKTCQLVQKLSLEDRHRNMIIPFSCLSLQWEMQFTVFHLSYFYIWKVKVKWSCYRPGVAQKVGRGTDLLFHDRGTRRDWVVSSMLQLHFTPWKDPVPIVQEAGWAPGPVWMGGKSRPNRDSILDHPARSQSLYQLSYPIPLYIWKAAINFQYDRR